MFRARCCLQIKLVSGRRRRTAVSIRDAVPVGRADEPSIQPGVVGEALLGIALALRRPLSVTAKGWRSGRPVNAAAGIVSVARIDTAAVDQLVRVRRAFPHIPVLGIVSEEVGDAAVRRAAILGAAGAEPVVDLRVGRLGWASLREALDPERLPSSLARHAVVLVNDVLGTTTAGWIRFIAAVFGGQCKLVADVATLGGVPRGSLMSRFNRAGLPSPKRYLEIALLARVAYHAESTTQSATAIANALNASSPQALLRIVRRLTGLTPTQWQCGNNVASVMAEFRASLLEPYIAVLRRFDPYQ